MGAENINIASVVLRRSKSNALLCLSAVEVHFICKYGKFSVHLLRYLSAIKRYKAFLHTAIMPPSYAIECLARQSVEDQCASTGTYLNKLRNS